MVNIRRAGLLFFVLVIGIFLGSLGTATALFIVAPLFIFWLLLFDEKRYRRHLNQYQQYHETDSRYKQHSH